MPLRNSGKLEASSRRLANLREVEASLQNGYSRPIVGIPTIERWIAIQTPTLSNDSSFGTRVTEDGRTRRLHSSLESGARICIAKHVRSGGLLRSGDVRAESGVAQLDAGTKTIHAAYKDLRRRDRFSADFRPTPYDVWSFRHDRAFGIPHPGAIPPAIVAHPLHYYTHPDALVVDPMAGGGTTLDVCQSMGRRCLAYDIHPTRPEFALTIFAADFPLRRPAAT